MRDAAEGLIFEAGAGLNVDTDAGKRTGEGFRGDTEAVGQSRDLVELGRFLFKLRLSVSGS